MTSKENGSNEKEYLQGNDELFEDEEKVREYLERNELDDPRLNHMLIEMFPFLVPVNKTSGKRITDCVDEDGERGFWPEQPDLHPEYDYEYTAASWIPVGWRRAFGLELLKELKREYEKLSEGAQKEFGIVKIKEKYGVLRIHTTMELDGVNEVTHKYLVRSQKTCIKCGKPAKYMTLKWISPYCASCLPWGESYEEI